MRKALLASAFMLGGVASIGAARADMIVFDPTNAGNTLNEVKNGVQEIAQLDAQLQQLINTYNQLKQQYTMLTTSVDVTNPLAALNATSVQNPMPQVAGLPNLLSGQTGSLSSGGQQFFTENNTYTAPGTDPVATTMNSRMTTNSNVLGMLQANLQAIETRLNNLNAMKQQISSATSIQQVTALNGRVAIEGNAVAAQQAQATNLAAMAQLQDQAQNLSLEQARRAELDAYLSTHSATLQ